MSTNEFWHGAKTDSSLMSFEEAARSPKQSSHPFLRAKTPTKDLRLPQVCRFNRILPLSFYAAHAHISAKPAPPHSAKRREKLGGYL